MFNKPTDAHRRALDKLFEHNSVAQLAELRRALGVRSRTTVFFTLKAAGYCTSYSHAGRYYTLARIPCFDAHGLWSHGEVRFSKHGTLRSTVVVQVRHAPAGHTHEELHVILGLRVHDTLRSLVNNGQLGRERVGAVYVYTDTDPERAALQLEQRRRTSTPTPVPGAMPTPPPPLDLSRVVDILVALIHGPKDDAATIAARLRLGGLAVTDKQVEAVFGQYGLGKKTARYHSKRSRR
jgi:hypothetical protein